MAAYFREPRQTAEALRGGWFHTGDLGCVDEGGFHTGDLGCVDEGGWGP